MQRWFVCAWLAALCAVSSTSCIDLGAARECVPRTCEDMGFECGAADDGCGNALECGVCPEGHACGVMETNRCYCEPRSCLDALVGCGEIDDGCGGTLDCGECSGTASCGGGGVPHVCGVPDEARLCRPSGLCWVNPLPLSLDGKGIAAASDDRAFAVGAGGTILAWDGERWSLAESTTTEDLFDVWAPAEDFAIAVGRGGTVLRFDGLRWSPEAVASDTNFVAVHGSSEQDVWIAGREAVLRYDGSAWESAASAPIPHLVDLWVGETVWAAGTEGRVYEYRQGRFEAIFDDDDFSFGAIWGRASGEAYAVGSQDVSEVDLNLEDPVFNPFDYRAIVLELPSRNLVAYDEISGFSLAYGNDEQVFAADYDNGKLVTLFGEPGPRGIANQGGLVAAASASPARHFALTAAGHLNRYEDSEWKRDVSGVLAPIADLSAAGDAVFAATADGRLVRFQGGPLVLNGSGVGTLSAIHAAAEDDVWAVGENRRVLHFDGRAIERLRGPDSSYPLDGVAKVESELFVAGLGVHRRSGEQWVAEDVPQNAYYYDLFVLDGAVYAAGSRVLDSQAEEAEGIVCTRVDGVWQTQTVPGMDRVVALHGTARDDLFAAGMRVEPGSFGGERLFAAIAHFDGEAWAVTEIEDLGELYDIAAIGDGKAVAIGYGGVIFEFEAGAVTEIDRIPGRAMNAIAASDGGWLVGGEAGAVLRMPR